MGRIQLLGLEFLAYHGVHPQEREQGNTFIVDVTLECDFSAATISDDINDTVDYQKVYKLIEAEMSRPVNLLETLSESILNKIFSLFPVIISLEVSVEKQNPPIGGSCRAAKVTVYKVR